jgi:hypothetical protein
LSAGIVFDRNIYNLVEEKKKEKVARVINFEEKFFYKIYISGR